MLTTLVKEPFDSSEWIFEIKWDGFRALCKKQGKKVELISRNDISFNIRFPLIVKELETIQGDFILDGELVVLDKKGHSQFQLMQNYKKGENPCYYLFDILFYKGKDLTKLPLVDRKKILKQFLKQRQFKTLRYSQHIETKGKAFFEKAKKKKLEGIIAKRKQSTYHFGRSREWLKIKCHLRQEVVIGGFTEPRGSRSGFGSLLVGVYEKGKLVYVGHVGGGFNEKLLKDVKRQLEKIKTKECPFKVSPKPNAPVTWVKPKLVCEVSFSEWTEGGNMRQPIFKGMRIDKSAKQIKREETL